jgi:hypothetical protein
MAFKPQSLDGLAICMASRRCGFHPISRGANLHQRAAADDAFSGTIIALTTGRIADSLSL